MKVDLDELRLTLATMKEVEGLDYAKSRDVAQRMPNSPSEIGQAMLKLQEAGDVEEWGYTNGTSWKITLDGESD